MKNTDAVIDSLFKTPSEALNAVTSMGPSNYVTDEGYLRTECREDGSIQQLIFFLADEIIMNIDIDSVGRY